MPKKAIIIGAGPAGLTAAYELLTRTDIIPIVLEKSGDIGGISRTINYKGNRMDMGPHRFFSKSDRVMDWWLKMMPLEESAAKGVKVSYQNKTREVAAGTATPQDPNKVMLVIQRLTRIYFLRKFFAYPIQLSIDTLKTLGLIRTIKILISFLWIRLFPRRPEKSLEDFIINKFGKELYLLFFKDYTEKVWGIAPNQISAEWGAQRIKGVSLSKAIAQAIKSLRKKKSGNNIHQKETETSLIEQFLYPKYGPGSLWEEVARQVQEMGGKIYLHQDVQRVYGEENKVLSVVTTNSQTGQTGAWEGDYFFSTMPVQELIAAMDDEVPTDVQEVAAGLQYRDFINVGILLKQLANKDGKKLELKDNWIYIQERDVKVGRLMIYNNWGGGMLNDPNTTWIGMEYFCNKTDSFWAESDANIQAIAIKELEKMDLARAEDVLDSTVRRMEKTYPAYFGTYGDFDKIKAYTNNFTNLFLVGRNGMHKYNNADHSMLTAMVAVDNIQAGVITKDNLWAINTEQEYHEEKKAASQPHHPEETLKQPVSTRKETFKDYLLNNRLNRTFLWIAGIAIIVQFIIFKILYPYAGFINGDSYVYIQSAYYNSNVNTYPIGYSKFLRLVSIFTKSDTALVAIQYLSIELSALYFIFKLYSIFSASRLVRWLLFVFVVFNPVFLYISNYVSSDSIFLSLSICWFTLLIQITLAPSKRLIALEIIVLLLAFLVRYNALYYPFIAALTFLFSKKLTMPQKILGIGLNITCIAIIVFNTSNEFYKLTGIREFTPFAGWQVANNAMYVYRYVDSAHIQKVPAQYQLLDKKVRSYFDTSRNIRTHPYEMILASTMYMWDARSPLQQFMKETYKMDSSSAISILRAWARAAPLYSGYGYYLIRHYPDAYLKFYIWPNAMKYYSPPEEFLGQYNMGRDTVSQWAKNWFEYKSKKVYTAFANPKVSVLGFMPILSGIANIVFLFGLFALFLLKGVPQNSAKSSVLLLASALWIANFLFSVFASPITLRYQLFTILLFYCFAILLIEIIYNLAFIQKKRPVIAVLEKP